MQNKTNSPTQPKKHGPGSAVDRLLSLWGEWHRTERQGRGYPSHSAGLATGGGSSITAFDDLCDAQELAACRIAERCVNDLSLPHRLVLHHSYLAAVWRFRSDPSALLDEALEEFYLRARKEVAWI